MLHKATWLCYFFNVFDNPQKIKNTYLVAKNEKNHCSPSWNGLGIKMLISIFKNNRVDMKFISDHAW